MHSMRKRCLQSLLAVAVIAEAQQPKKISGWRIWNTALLRRRYSEGISCKGLSELGYIEGKNIIIEYRYADGQGRATATSLRLNWFVSRLIIIVDHRD